MLNEIESLLRSFPPASQEEGRRRFAEPGGSDRIQKYRKSYLVSVQRPSGAINVQIHDSLTLNNIGKCICGEPLCEHLFAALLAIQAREGRIRGRDMRAGAERLWRTSRRGRAVTSRDVEAIFPGWATKAKPEDLEVIREATTRVNDPRIFRYVLAYLARRLGFYIPPLLASEEALAKAEEPLREIEQAREDQQWADYLMHLGGDLDIIHLPVDLALVLDPAQKTLRTVIQTTERWEAVPRTQLVDLLKAFSSEHLPVVPASTPLWSWLEQHLPLFQEDLLSLDHLRPLRLILLDPRNGERVLTPALQPYSRGHAKWVLEEEEDRYALRLKADELEVVPLVSIAGAPTFHITENAIYESSSSLVGRPGGKPTYPLEVPQRIAESEEGLRFLERVKAQLPESFTSRFETVELGPLLRCWLVPSGKGEEVIVDLVGVSKDGTEWERFSVMRWVQPSKRARATLFQRKHYALGVKAYEALPLKPSRAERGLWGMRVTSQSIEQFCSWVESLPKEVPIELDKELATLFAKPVSGALDIEIEPSGIDWFDLSVNLTSDDDELTQEELKALLKAKGGFVRLKGRGWRRLEFTVDQENAERLAEIGVPIADLSGEPQRLHTLQLASERALSLLPETTGAQIRARASELKAKVTPAVPKAIRAKLREYQLEGYHFLAYLSTNRFGGILADDMGLGKTLQTLAWIAWLRREEKDKKILVVCPKSVSENWRDEAQKFYPSLRVEIWNQGEFRTVRAALKEADLLVVNYAQLRLVGDELSRVKWLAAILDEGQYIKNPNSITAKTAFGLKAEHRLVLTGTPIENKLLDLWSLMQFAMPGVLGNRAYFSRSFEGREDTLSRRRLSARVRPFLLRRTKEQVAPDLPDRIEKTIHCQMEKTQRLLYQAELKRARQVLRSVESDRDFDRVRFHVLSSLLKLRQICCHPKLVHGKAKESAKVDALLETLEPLMEEGKKVIVFSQFTTMLDILHKEIEDQGWKTYLLTGQTNDRGALVSEFQTDEEAAVFLISLRAGGAGITLTAASYVVLFDPWWNPAAENQAIDRTHRIGQKSAVVAYRLIAKDSIEEKILELQKHKTSLMQNVLGDDSFSSALSLKDLRYLFSEDLDEKMAGNM